MTSYRVATRADASAIFDVLVEVAPEIPLRLDTPNRKVLLFKRILTGCVTRNVWIAVNRDNRVIGFLLAEPDGQGLDLTYGGVRTAHRSQHIFPKLVAKMMARGVPLTATVLQTNVSNMADRLLKLGFTKDFPMLNDRDSLRWSPTPSDIPGGGMS